MVLLGAASDKGVLTIQCVPGTEVWWEGVSVGQTNENGVLVIQDIPPGVFRIGLKKNGFKELAAEIDVGPGEKSVTFKLERSELKRSPRKVVKQDSEKASGERSSKSARPSPGVQAQRSSPSPVEGNPAASYPVTGYLLALALAGGGIYCFKKYRLKLSCGFSPAAAPPPLQEQKTGEQPEVSPTPPVIPRDDFLEALKTREKMMEEGVEIVTPRDRSRVIDVEARDIREVEDES